MRGVEYGDANIQRTMEEDLRERLKLGRPLRVYQGFDPTFTGLTLGNLVGLLKLRQFQRFGHEVTFLIGNMTAIVGDPSDRSAARQMLTVEQVEANARDWLQQAYRVLDPVKTIVRRNGDWLSPLTLAEVIQLASNFTVAEFLAHETFRKRMEEARPLYIHEFIYALLQAYDAYHMQTDVQVGGSDQLFNIMAGRKLQQALGERPLVAICTPLLIGTDGHLKMSKSVGNSISLDESPSDMYGKLMSIPDSLMVNYYTLLTDVPAVEIVALERGLAERSVNPMDAKKRLAHSVVALLNDEATADAAQSEFERVFQRGQQPEEAIAVDWTGLPEGQTTAIAETATLEVGAKPVLLTKLIADHIGVSMSEARRLIRQGAVSVDGEVTKQDVIGVKRGTVIRVGRHRFLRILGNPQADD